MHKLYLFVFSACVLAAPSCYAGPALTLGPYVGATLGYSDVSLRFREGAATLDGLGLSGVSVGVLAGYLAPLGAGGVLGVEFSGAVENADGEARDGGFREKFEVRNSFGVSVLGGRFVGGALVYARAGYGRAKGKVTVSEPGFSASATETFSGPGVGVGVVVPVTDSIALRAAYSRYFYGEENGFKPEQGKFDVGLAWSF